ncbi:hypothetical protein [Methylomonas koyamae]|uniref:hypothetical protein n=1 Tax=Methylomonas koyamae TaxID=702114 RepID=UPI00210FBC94|nr:hypothetical protein [Methylomonas koyamae]
MQRHQIAVERDHVGEQGQGRGIELALQQQGPIRSAQLAYRGDDSGEQSCRIRFAGFQVGAAVELIEQINFFFLRLFGEVQRETPHQLLAGASGFAGFQVAFAVNFVSHGLAYPGQFFQ